MANFDFLQDIPELQPLYAYCRDAENFQLVAPDKSVTGARKALEYWVKLVYLTNGWDMPQRVGLMELVSNSDFVDYVGDPQVMDNIHFIRRIGNQGAHGQPVHKRESLQALACLHAIIGEWLMLVGVIDTFPHFDPTLVPKIVTLSIVSQNGEPVLSTESLQKYAQNSEGKTLHVKPPQVLTEADTRRMFIDLMLREAGWQILDAQGAILAGKACIEVELQGMPNSSETGYADYVLFSDDMKPLAVIEAKRTSRDPKEGKHQAELYAELLEKAYHIKPVIYYSNGFETYVQDGLGYPDRRVFSFHTKSDLELLIQKRTRKDIISNHGSALHLPASEHQASPRPVGYGYRNRQNARQHSPNGTADTQQLGKEYPLFGRPTFVGQTGTQKLPQASSVRDYYHSLRRTSARYECTHHVLYLSNHDQLHRCG